MSSERFASVGRFFSALRWGGAIAAAAVALNASGHGLVAQAPLPTDVVCFPTCQVNDGRFLVVAGNDPTTLGGSAVLIGLSAGLSSPRVGFGLFDGDKNGLNWDNPRGNSAPDLQLDLYADPDGMGPDAPATTAQLLHTWSTATTAFPNNDWLDLSVDNDLRAATTGRYRYLLKITAIAPAANIGWNSFKIRTSGTIGLTPQLFAFLAALNNPGVNPAAGADARIIYPAWTSRTPTTYDGTWQFAFAVPEGQTEVSVWDGDMDFGNSACTYKDTDDPDSPQFPFFPQPSASPEGVAVGIGTCPSGIPGVPSGNPQDDSTGVNFKRALSRLGNPLTGGNAYEIVDPNGVSYVNLEPSGNLEWEQFKIVIAPDANPAQPCLDSVPVGDRDAAWAADRANFDCKAVSLPAGPYLARLDGIDMANLNFWYFAFPAVGSTPSGTPAEEDAFYRIGRLVWYDDNANGLPDPGESGIPGVTVTVRDSDGQVQSGVTTETGEFFFRKPAGAYSVTVDPSNYAGPLQGWTTTTGSETKDANVGIAPENNDYDEVVFGYVERGSNIPPTSRPDSATLMCGASTTIYVLANDTDLDGDAITITAVSGASHGSVDPNPDGSIRYTPSAGYVGPDSFTYTITDQVSGSSTTTVSVTVSNQNPVARDDSAATASNTPVNVLVLGNDYDPDGAMLSVVSVTNGTSGLASVNADGSVTYTPGPGFSGSDTFTYTVGEGCGTATATVTVTVAPPPAPPAVCYAGSSNSSMSAIQSWVSNPDGSLTLRTTLSRSFLDNTYGANAIGWPGGGGGGNHKFNHLVTSDMVQLALYDAAGAKRLEFKLDYFSQSASSPTGYQSLGTWGGDGGMVSGSGSMIVSADSSLATNFRFGPSYQLTVDSPATDASFTPNPTYPNWIFDAWYEVTVKPEAFGAGGFGYPRITAMHASPSKTGVETEPLKVVDCAGRTIPVPKNNGGSPNGSGGSVKGKK